MDVPESGRLLLAPDLEICRVLNGMWQVSGAHGLIQADAAVQEMFDYVDAGLTTWDLADHYGPAEDFIGQFRSQWAAKRGSVDPLPVQTFTKWVPRPGNTPRSVVEAAVGLSLRRMDAESLDMLQFHWWDYQDPAYLEAVTHLMALQQQGWIRHLGLTNFDTEHLKHIVDQGASIVSNQVQYSIIDRRPQVQMVPFCQEHNIHLLAYGTLAGGLLTERYLGHPEPARSTLDTASLRKYKQMISAWGDWELFQGLLATLKSIADKHGVSIANVATRYVLEQPAVAGVIVGVRLGVREHRQENIRVFQFSLDQEDHQMIESIASHSNDLYRLIGDCGDEYRR